MATGNCLVTNILQQLKHIYTGLEQLQGMQIII